MPQLQVPLTTEEIDLLERYATKHSTPLEDLIREYLSYLLEGGEPVIATATDIPSSTMIASIAAQSGSFHWLEDEPDIYTLDDGDPV
jgi:hypothetical protein